MVLFGAGWEASTAALASPWPRRRGAAFKFHLDIHLFEEDTHLYRIVTERFSVPEQDKAVGDDWAELTRRMPELLWLRTEPRISCGPCHPSTLI